jgi:O-antigen ligase
MTAVTSAARESWAARRAALRARAATVGLAEWLAYTLIVLSPLTVYRVSVGINLSPQRLMLLLLAGTLCFEIARRGRRPPRLSRHALVALAAMLAFFAYELTQLTRTQQSAFSARFLGAYAAGMLVVAVLVVVIDSELVLRRAILAFWLSAIVPVAIGLYQLIGASLGFIPTLPFASLLSTDQLFLGNFTTEVRGLAVPRVPSTMAAPAFFGEFLAFVAIAMLALLLLAGERRARRLLPAAALLALALVNLVATFARSAWLLFALGALMVVLQARHQLKAALFAPGRRWLLPAVAVICVALLPILPVPVGETVSGVIDSLDIGRDSAGAIVEQRYAGETLTLNPTTIDAQSTAASTETHLQLRRSALELFAERPLTGIGLGNYGVRTDQVEGVSSAQSYGFTVLAEGGLIGIALFATMLLALVAVARRAYRSRARDTPLGAALLGVYVIVGLLVLNNLVLYDTLYLDTSWIVMGLAIAAGNVMRPRAGAVPAEVAAGAGD